MSKVILCIVRPSQQFSEFISEQILVEYFSMFGKVHAIEIFCQNVLVKLFVEFSTVESKNRSLELKKNTLTYFGRICIYQSNKSFIVKKKNNTEQSNFKSTVNFHHQLKTDFISQNHLVHSFQNETMNPQMLYIQPTVPTINSYTEFEQLNRKFPTIGSNLLQEQPERINDQYLQKSEDSFDYNLPIRTLAQRENRRDFHVIVINKLQQKIVTLNHLYNLISCFGNVNKILMSTCWNYAFVELKIQNQAENVVKNLDKLFFFGSKIRFKMSKYSTLNFKSIKKLKNETFFYFDVNLKNDSFFRDGCIRYTSPSNLLRFSKLPKEMTIFLWLELIGEIHKPAQISRMSQSENGEDYFFAVFQNVSETCEVLACLNNLRVNSARIVVDFADL